MKLNPKLIIVPLLLIFLITQESKSQTTWAILLSVENNPADSWKVYEKIEELDFNPMSIRAVRLNNLGLKKIPENLAKCGNIEFLDLSGNDIVLTDQDCKLLANFSKLEILKLGKNKIKILPPEFFKLTHLKNISNISIASNEISSISNNEWSFPSLQCLDISRNPIEAIPTTLGNLKQLKILRASGCKISTWADPGKNNNLLFVEMNARASQWHGSCQPTCKTKLRQLLGYEPSVSRPHGSFGSSLATCKFAACAAPVAAL